MRAYDEVIEFIASQNPREVVAFKPSDQAKRRVWELIERQKENHLTPEEQGELDVYLQIEHMMRLAKARAHKLLAHEH
jgi:hypothetical protein